MLELNSVAYKPIAESAVSNVYHPAKNIIALG